MPPSELTIGAIVSAPITLVTSDKNDLACAANVEVSGNRCGFTEAGAPLIGFDSRRILAPYRTTSGDLFLIAGLFDLPTVSERYTQDPPDGRNRDSLRRFIANCAVKLVGQADYKLRWLQAAPFDGPVNSWVAVPLECTIE
jgi:hypothetical protein